MLLLRLILVLLTVATTTQTACDVQTEEDSGISTTGISILQQTVHKHVHQPQHAYLLDVTAVIIETRPLVALPVVVRNLNYQLPGVSIQIFYAASNEAFLKKLSSLAELQEKRILTLSRLPEPFYSHGVTGYGKTTTYSQLVWNKSFWQRIEPLRKKVLMFEADSWVCSGAAELMEPFKDYALVGAPFFIPYSFCPGGVGNGGFSLRDRQTLIKILEKYEKRKYEVPDLVEDLAFCRFLTSEGYKMPNRTAAAAFSWGPQKPLVHGFKTQLTPEVYASSPLIRSAAVHKPRWFKMFGHDIKKIDEICPGVALLDKIGAAMDDGSGKDVEHAIRQWEAIRP